jgi:S-formylglutathione hydrolase FrmB
VNGQDATDYRGWAVAGSPWGHDWQGTFHDHLFDSEALTGNTLGDPHQRPLTVYTPPAYEREPDRRFPVIYQIQGLTSQLDMWRNRKAFQRTVPETIDLAFSAPGQAPALVVSVDCWTSLGGSQFLDSPGTGRYLTYLCDEIIPWVDATYRTLPEAAHRAVAGKSSGGYGAMVLPMHRPDRFGALATHAGDALFEACYAPDIGKAVRTLRDKYDGSFESFWNAFHSRLTTIQAADYEPLNMWCMAACYSADPDGPHPVRSRHRPADSRDLGSLAGPRPGADGRRARRRRARPARDLDRRRNEGRVLPRPRGRGLSPRAREGRRRRADRAFRAGRGHPQ